MATIMIENLDNTVLEVKDLSITLLEHFHHNNIDWMHACGGKGRCTTCKVIIKEGFERFQPLTNAEEKYKMVGDLKQRERLACQAKITGDVTLIVPLEYQLPHVRYSDNAKL